MKDQEQNASEGSTAIQAGRDIIVTKTGLSYSDAREVALDVFRANFHQLAGLAKTIAEQRATELTDKFLSKLQLENPAGLDQSQDPDFQYQLFTVQKDYARNGHKDLGDLLVDLLVDRSKQEQRDILQIVLNESIRTAPMLTDSQLAALAVIFLSRYTQNLQIGNHNQLGAYFDKHVAPFVPKLVKNEACYQHLEFTGCGTVGIGIAKLESIIGTTYQGHFLKGFDVKVIAEKNISIGVDERFFIHCLNDATKWQVRANNKEMLDKALDAHAITLEDRGKISSLFDIEKMNDEEVRKKCVEIRPYMSRLFDVWADSAMKHFTLTSVGIAIGHANIKRLVGEFANLAIWIN